MSKSTHNQNLDLDGETTPEHIDQSLELLKLIASQLQAAICDNNQAMAELTSAHGVIADQVHTLHQQQTGTPESQLIHDELSRMIIAFQSHDALNQRVEHAVNSLEAISEHWASNELRNDPEAWQNLKQRLSSSYTTLQEKRIHEMINQSNEKPGLICSDTSPAQGSVELF